MYAAGLTMKEDNVSIFTERFDNYVRENITEEQTQPQIDIDAIIRFSDITPKFFNILQQFAPYGPENMKPIFATHKVTDFGSSRLVGKELEHLKLELTEPNSENVMNGIPGWGGRETRKEFFLSSEYLEFGPQVEAKRAQLRL